ncbi:MAG: hypothetical protein K0S32_4575 [Bacteroidetes bacterium]|jgi:hypothetical protein|nr:hypothetical protein [Bacteroidota bacterium]
MEQCPICFEELIVQDCAPCDDCGHHPEELEHFKQNLHTYKTYEIYKGLRLTLCNFCEVDFGSYKSEYLGFKKGRRLGFQNFSFIQDIRSPQITKDKVCLNCSHRLKFLKFLSDIRLLNEND